MGHDQKNEITDTSGRNEFSPEGGWGLPERSGEKFSHPGEARSRAAAPLRRKEPVEVVRASSEDASWTPPQGGVPGMSSWEEAAGKTQDQVAGLHLRTGLSAAKDSPGRAGWSCQGKGGLELTAGTAASATRPRISG